MSFCFNYLCLSQPNCYAAAAAVWWERSVSKEMQLVESIRAEVKWLKKLIKLTEGLSVFVSQGYKEEHICTLICESPLTLS